MVSKRAEDIANRKPVQHDRGVMVLDPDSVKPYRHFLQYLDNSPHRRIHIRVQWLNRQRKDKDVAKGDADKPSNVFLRLTKAANHVGDHRCSHLRISQGGRLHGDSHYENFLIDASVPFALIIFTTRFAFVVTNNTPELLKAEELPVNTKLVSEVICKHLTGRRIQAALGLLRLAPCRDRIRGK